MSKQSDLPNDPRWKKLGKRYKRLRKKRGLTQEDAIDYGFTLKYYRALEEGKPHTLTTLFKLAAMYNIKPSQLVKGIFD